MAVAVNVAVVFPAVIVTWAADSVKSAEEAVPVLVISTTIFCVDATVVVTVVAAPSAVARTGGWAPPPAFARRRENAAWDQAGLPFSTLQSVPDELAW